MKFPIDAQHPPGLAAWLRARSHETHYLKDRGRLSDDDRTIWRIAADHGYILVTKDRDFEDLAVRDQAGPQLLWLRVGDLRKGQLFDHLSAVWTRIEETLLTGVRIVEAW